MNLLFVTENTQDAAFAKQELAKEIPGLHVEISPDVQDANRQLANPGNYSAVLLDSRLHEGDPLAIIKTLRAREMAVAAIGLIEPADLVSGINMMGAGADDYVVKRPGFVATLAGVIQRACGHYSTPQKLEQKAAPVRRNPTGATCVLLRNIVDPHASLVGTAESDQQGERGSGETADADATARNSEIRLHEREAILSSARTSGEIPLHLKEEFSTARLQWEKERRDLDERLKSAEERHPISDVSLREAAGNAQMADGFRDGMQAVKKQLGELESRCRNLEENLQSTRASLAEQTKVLQEEREQRALETEGFRTQLNVLEEQRKALESQLADRTEELRVGREQWDLRRTAWEQHLAAVEESFAKIEHAVLLHEAQQEELAARFGADLSRSENARRDLEQELHGTEEERARLQESLRVAEARIVEQAEQFRTEREQWETVRSMSDRQRDALEARVVQLEAARDELATEYRETLDRAEKSRQEMESSAAVLAGELQLLKDEHGRSAEKQESARLQWEADRNELEQRKAALEEELRLAKESLEKQIKEEESCRLRWESSLNELEQLRADAGSALALAREAVDKYLQQVDKLRQFSSSSSVSTTPA